MTDRVGELLALRLAGVTGSTAGATAVDGRFMVEKSCVNSSSAFLLNSMVCSPVDGLRCAEPRTRKSLARNSGAWLMLKLEAKADEKRPRELLLRLWRDY